MLTVGLFPNLRKDRVKRVVEQVLSSLAHRNIQAFMLQEHAEQLKLPHLGRELDDLRQQIDIAITFGGDGTLLWAARQMAQYEIPVLGVNLGRLGFLTEVEVPEIQKVLDLLVSHQYDIEKRSMLRAVVVRNGQETANFDALNDVVITKGGFARMLRLHTYIDNDLMATYPADGLILSTATGSTGYSLSAGGPIISPSLKVIVITPICPHILNSRPVVVSNCEQIKVALEATHEDIVLTVDGQSGYQLRHDDVVLVYSSPYSAQLIRTKHRSFYELMRAKLAGNPCD